MGIVSKKYVISEFTYCTVECASVLERKNLISSSLTRLLKTLLMRNEGIERYCRF